MHCFHLSAFWWKHHVDYIETGYQGANLQLARKSMQLPKCLLILKGPIWIFLEGQQPSQGSGNKQQESSPDEINLVVTISK